MNRKIRAVLFALPGAAVLAAAIGGGLWYHSRGPGLADELKRLPLADAVVVNVHFAALRQAGLLSLLTNSKVAEEAEYQEFERRTGFAYQRDLDGALLAVAPTGKYLLVRGRFDWAKLRAYAASQGGRCDGSLCRMQGSQPDRRISFFPLRSDLMALAVSPDDSAALRLSTPANTASFEPPAAPLWVSIPGTVLQSSENLPAETRSFAKTLSRANSMVLALEPEAKRFVARLEVRCRNQQDAAELAAQLNRLTDQLRHTFANERQKPNAADLTGVLVSGSFAQVDSRVTGYWPIERVFLENLIGG